MRLLLLVLLIFLTFCNGHSQNIIKTKTEFQYNLQIDSSTPLLSQKKIFNYDSLSRFILITEYSYFNDFIKPPKESLIKEIWFYYNDHRNDSIVEFLYIEDEKFKDYIYCIKFDSARRKKSVLKTNSNNEIFGLSNYSYIDSTNNIRITYIKDSLPALYTYTKTKKVDYLSHDSLVFKSVEKINQFGRTITTLYNRSKDSLVKEIHNFRADIKKSVYETVIEKFTVINGIKKIISRTELKREPEIPLANQSIYQEFYKYDAKGNLIELKYLINNKVFQLSKFKYEYR